MIGKSEQGHRSKRTIKSLRQLYCIKCLSHEVGSIGSGRYFCASCCSEFTLVDDVPTVYSISDDGNLVNDWEASAHD